MKIILLSSASSIHTIQWATHLKHNGYDVEVISQHPKSEQFPNHIKVHILPFSGAIGYFLNALPLRKLLVNLKPDILNAHYASGYGTTARLANFHPYILSVWGSDIFIFPNKSFAHKVLLQKNLESADSIASTSIKMREGVESLLRDFKPIYITPFGVNLSQYQNIERLLSKNLKLNIGTVKSLKHIYGIDILLKTFSIFYKEISKKDYNLAQKINFRIVGGGPQLEELKLLASDLGIGHITHFIGKVPHNKVINELKSLDIYLALSRSESFGVSVIEAQASGIPVIVTDVGGLPEVVSNGKTGFLVPKEDPHKAAEKLEYLVLNENVRQTMGLNARKFVMDRFAWDKCVQHMAHAYKETIKFS